MLDALRLSFGTFTGVKVEAPTKVNAHLMKMSLLLSFLPALMVSGTAWAAGYLAFRFTSASLVAAVVVVGAEILLTAGLHIDGLLDTADGAAAFAKNGRERALEIMKTGNSGPTAFATGSVVLLLQIAALSTAIAKDISVSWIICSVLARLAVVTSCRTGAKRARPDGLGNPFIGSVDFLWLIPSVVINFAIVAALGIGQRSALIVTACLVALAFAEILKRSAEKKFGGLTGDVLGSILEKVRTASLLVLIVSF